MPVDHVQRDPLPWRQPLRLSECGRTPGAFAMISRAELREIEREWGDLVAAWRRANPGSRFGPPGVPRPNVCMVCWQTAHRCPTWAHNPAQALHREYERYGSPLWVDGENGAEAQQLRRELWALGRLATALPDQFARLTAEMKDGYRRD